jgi:hypothetical protein
MAVKKEEQKDQGKFIPPRADTQFCQQASKQYELELDEAGGDPRSALGNRALREARKKKGHGCRHGTQGIAEVDALLIL